MPRSPLYCHGQRCDRRDTCRRHLLQPATAAEHMDAPSDPSQCPLYWPAERER